MLISPTQSLLLVIDIQQKLVPAVCQPQQLIDKTRWLMEIAKLLEVPTLISEQYPQGLGHTVDNLAELVDAERIFDKLHFSCAAEPECRARIEREQRRQIVICGMEAHVCVLQSATELLEQGFEVFVIADLVSSRAESDRLLALDRMRQLGIQVVSREMVAFEWMQKSGTESFRTISKNYLR